MSTLYIKFIPELIVFFGKSTNSSVFSKQILGELSLFNATQKYFENIMQEYCKNKDCLNYMLAVEDDSLRYQIIELTNCENNEPKA